MSRKVEAGIEYFPLNTDIVINPKFKLVVAEFGSKVAWTVLLPIYCKIYREKGYWMDWFDEDSKLLFAQDECKVEVNVLNEFINGCVRRSLFDKRVFDLFGVLTSDRIQANYLEATKRRITHVDVIEEFIVDSDNVEWKRENVNIIPLNVNIISKNVNSSTQSKGRGNKKESESSVHTQEQKDFFKKFHTWVNANAARVNQMKEPVTINQYLKLKEKLSVPVMQSVITSMHNNADLTRKYISAYLTILKWAAREPTAHDNSPKSKVDEWQKAADRTAAIAAKR